MAHIGLEPVLSALAPYKIRGKVWMIRGRVECLLLPSGPDFYSHELINQLRRCFRVNLFCRQAAGEVEFLVIRR
jgi:hypothetical protein